MGEPGTEKIPTPAPKRQSQKGSVNFAVLVAGVMELVSTVLSELMNPAQATAAISKAKKQPAVKAMLAAGKTKTSPKGPAACRSAYNVFLQDFLGHMKAAGHDVNLMQAAGIWSILPSETKSDLKRRYDAIMQSYNEQLAAGTSVSLTEVTQTYLHDNNLEPVDHTQLWEQFKGAAAQATVDKAATAAAAAAATSNDGKRHLSTAAEKPAAAAAAAPSKVATGKRGGQDQQQMQQQQSKKQKTEKEIESSKHKSHKKKKAKHDKKHKKRKSKRDSRHTSAASTEAPASSSKEREALAT